MKRRNFIRTMAASSLGAVVPSVVLGETGIAAGKRRLFITGGSLHPKFISHIASLTAKPNPKICFVPTAVGDSPARSNTWYESVEDLQVRPYVLRSFINSDKAPRDFAEIIMGMDAIVVGGGNTLNMLAIWKAQGIDTALRRAYDAGKVIAGGSAGSLCWFEHGTTDSRPVKISKVDCLGWIKGSHCPHYDSEATRRPLYHEMIQRQELAGGYACDDHAGILFEDEQAVHVVSLDDKSKAYRVDLVQGRIEEKILPAELLK